MKEHYRRVMQDATTDAKRASAAENYEKYLAEWRQLGIVRNEYVRFYNTAKACDEGVREPKLTDRKPHNIYYDFIDRKFIDREPNIIEPNPIDRDCAIHRIFELNEVCMLAMNNLPFAIPREFAADFEYVTGRAAPRWLELCMPTGEVMYREEDPANGLAAHVLIDQVCDGLCSPEWGARQFGEMCGTIIMTERP